MTLAINQFREGSRYSDVLDRLYEIPTNHIHLFPETGTNFVYFEPFDSGNAIYFGAGKITPIKNSFNTDSKGHENRCFARIENYFDFADPVSMRRHDGTLWEHSTSEEVRIIPDLVYQELLEAGGRSVSFVADAHLIQVLGEQLIASEKVGILELIKNAFDANAQNCAVRIEKIPGLLELYPSSDAWVAQQDGPVITIEDDGAGMSDDEIVNGWLRPATTIKTQVKERLKAERQKAKETGREEAYDALVAALKFENGGRLPLGEKGVGRFATQRLGRGLQICTKKRGDKVESVLTIDWDSFNTEVGRARDLSGVGFSLRKQTPSWAYGKNDSGTQIRITRGREGFEWDEEKLKDIGLAVAQLKSPHKKKDGFNPTFWTPYLEDSDFEIPFEIADVPFKCEVAVDEYGEADISLHFAPPPGLKMPMAPLTREFRVDLREKETERWKVGSKLRNPRCGSFYLSISCWIRKQEWIHGVNWKQLTAYLDHYGGVAIFRDGLNIVSSEMGSVKDWLQLSTKHIKKGSNISYYNLWGGVELMQEKSLDIIANTSREGLLDTVPFQDLAALVRGAIDELQLFVQGVRDTYEDKKSGLHNIEAVTRRSKQIELVARRIAERYDFIEDPMALNELVSRGTAPAEMLLATAENIEILRETISQLGQQIDGLIEAAGFGLSIGVAVHEIEKVTSTLASRIARLKSDVSEESKHWNRVKELDQTAQSLRSEIRHIGPLRLTRVERPSVFGIRQALLAAMGGFRGAWTKAGIDCPLPESNSDFRVKQRFGACTQVFANLLDNATYWVQGNEKENAKRRILATIDADRRIVIIADSGPGIADRIKDHLFEPFYSLKSPPSGLGLYICKHYMNQMSGDRNEKGEVREARPEERIKNLDGAQFVVEFPDQNDLL